MYVYIDEMQVLSFLGKTVYRNFKNIRFFIFVNVFEFLLKLIRAVICTTGHMLKVQLSLKNDRVCTVASKVPGGQIQIAQGQMKICLRA